MSDKLSREPARDPQDLERLLVSRERAETPRRVEGKLSISLNLPAAVS